MSKPKVLDRFVKEPDLECHVRKVSMLGTEFLEVRDYIPSTGTYSRGILTEARHVDRLIEALQVAREHVGIPSGSRAPGENQLTLT